MKAMRIHRTGGPEMFQEDELPVPRPGPGEALSLACFRARPCGTFRKRFGPARKPHRPPTKINEQIGPDRGGEARRRAIPVNGGDNVVNWLVLIRSQGIERVPHCSFEPKAGAPPADADIATDEGGGAWSFRSGHAVILPFDREQKWCSVRQVWRPFPRHPRRRSMRARLLSTAILGRGQVRGEEDRRIERTAARGSLP
jgi:hypothetical protein